MTELTDYECGLIVGIIPIEAWQTLPKSLTDKLVKI